MSIIKEGNKCTILWQNNSSQGNIDFVYALYQCFKEGYEYKFHNLTDEEPVFTPMYKRIVLHKIEDEVILKEENKEDDLDSLTKKDELLEYAQKNDIEVPEEMKLPSQIKKFIKESLDV